MKPYRICAICNVRVRRDKDRLCLEHINIYKNQLEWDATNKTYKVMGLTEPWLKSIIEYSEYEYNLSMRDYKRIISLEKVKNYI